MDLQYLCYRNDAIEENGGMNWIKNWGIWMLLLT